MTNIKTRVKLEDADKAIDKAAKELFSDPRVRSVGIGVDHDSHVFVAVRNEALILPFAATAVEPATIESIPVCFVDTAGEIEHLRKFPIVRPTTVGLAEQSSIRPLCIGLEIQNLDCDARAGTLAQGYMTVGTLGCFVKLSDNSDALLTNNHVIGGENSGHKNSDRVQQPGQGFLNPQDFIATLKDFVQLQVSAQNASYAKGNAQLNDVDAAVGSIVGSVAFRQDYHPSRGIEGPY